MCPTAADAAVAAAKSSFATSGLAAVVSASTAKGEKLKEKI